MPGSRASSWSRATAPTSRTWSGASSASTPCSPTATPPTSSPRSRTSPRGGVVDAVADHDRGAPRGLVLDRGELVGGVAVGEHGVDADDAPDHVRDVGVDTVLADCDPADKLAAIEDESARGATIMVGDGIN